MRYDMYSDNFTENYLLNSTVQKFWKSAGEDMDKNLMSCFFRLMHGVLLYAARPFNGINVLYRRLQHFILLYTFPLQKLV